MKPFKILLILLILLTGCRTKKSTVESSITSSKKVDTSQSVNTQDQTKVSNDKTSDLETTTVKTTYYPPAQDKASEIKKTDTEKDVKGPIQSIEVTTTKKADVDKSKTETSQAKQEVNQTGSKENSSVKTTESKEAKVPIQWGWIFGVLVIVIVIGFYLNRKFGIVGRIKKMLGISNLIKQ